ncbi:hypothetical protein AAIB33_01515 [Microbacterium sp. AZCO]|uniref:hypothetical protein n=1 Tax=Microbacterium sp. AZCO TaxID=3142976 RepID=UPI0031F4058E
MSNAPHAHHSDDARPDGGSPTDAVTDEVRQAAAEAESGRDLDPVTGPESSDGAGDPPDDSEATNP